jgi:Sec-independent protein translocase protein TatA
MPSIGVSELILVIVIAVLVLKPTQMVSAWLQCKRALFKVRTYTNTLEQEYLHTQKQQALSDRIAKAAKVSDVSDLMNDHES